MNTHLHHDRFWFAVRKGSDNYGQPVFGPVKSAWGRLEHRFRRVTNRLGDEVVSQLQLVTAAIVPPDAVIWLDEQDVGLEARGKAVMSVNQTQGVLPHVKGTVVYL